MHSSIRILHIDNSEEVLELSKDVIESKNANLDVQSIQDPDEALKMIRNNSYDCIIGDHDMRGMNSVKLIEEIRSFNSAVPFILFTEQESAELINKAFSSGVTDYVRKEPGLKSYDLLYMRIINYVELHDHRREVNETGVENQEIVENLRDVYRLTSSKRVDFEDKKQELLEIGLEQLGFETAFLSEISEGQLKVQNAVSENDQISEGDVIEMEDTYCQHTIQHDEDLLVIDEAEEYWEPSSEKNPYDIFGLETYIGAKLKVEGEIYGTLCFTTEDDRGLGVDESGKAMVEIMTRWISYELEKQQRTAELHKTNERLERFADIISHDLRNPLSVATSYLELEKEENNSKNIRKVEKSLNRIDSIVDTCLTISMSKDSVSTSQVSLDTVVEESLFAVGSEDMNLVKNFDSSSTIDSNRSQLRIMLENIIKNTEDHGSEPIEVELKDEKLIISDNGEGFTSDIEDLFDFGECKDGGCGIGLYLVKRVCENHDWDFTAYNDDGAVFEITGV